jgi:hypothetical protein
VRVEVTNVSAHGVWLLAAGKESFMPYDELPRPNHEAHETIATELGFRGVKRGKESPERERAKSRN